jgi:outer membrane protein assembly factor BamC
MSRPWMKLTLTASVVLMLGACSTLQGDKVDYKSAGKGPTLEVPPDLTSLSRDTRFAVPGGPVTASGYAAGANTPGVSVAASTVADVRVERDGNKRWLVVARTPEQLYPLVRDFWQENGFLLSQDQPNLGIMETDWAENRAKLPQDFIRNTLGRVLDSLYDTGERDKFRTRLERGASGTEIYLTHRGMVEKLVAAQNSGVPGTVWEPRASDPELEAEFLRRMMVKLGVAQEASQAQIAAGALRPTSRVASAGGVPVVQVDEGFDRAWRRVGLALDRTGFTVEDRDRAQGMYFVRYVEPKADNKEPGFFGRLFGAGSKEEAPLRYRIAVRSQGESTTVSVLTAQGQPESSANAQRIVKVIADDMR